MTSIMQKRFPKTCYLILADYQGFLLLLNSQRTEYILPSIPINSLENLETEIAQFVQAHLGTYITGTERFIDSPGSDKMYMYVKHRGPVGLTYNVGRWADPSQVVDEGNYPYLDRVLKQWELLFSPVDKLISVSRSQYSEPFLRGMKAGFDYKRRFQNPEIMLADREHYDKGWMKARKRTLIRQIVPPGQE